MTSSVLNNRTQFFYFKAGTLLEFSRWQCLACQNQTKPDNSAIVNALGLFVQY